MTYMLVMYDIASNVKSVLEIKTAVLNKGCQERAELRQSILKYFRSLFVVFMFLTLIIKFIMSELRQAILKTITVLQVTVCCIHVSCPHDKIHHVIPTAWLDMIT